MLPDHLSDFIITQNGYQYETSLSTGFHFIECPTCYNQIPLFVIPPVSEYTGNLVQGLDISDDPRFPAWLSIRCPKCNEDIQFCTGDETDNPFIDDPMLVYSREDWREE